MHAMQEYLVLAQTAQLLREAEEQRRIRRARRVRHRKRDDGSAQQFRRALMRGRVATQ